MFGDVGNGISSHNNLSNHLHVQKAWLSNTGHGIRRHGWRFQHGRARIRTAHLQRGSVTSCRLLVRNSIWKRRMVQNANWSAWTIMV